MGFNLNFAPVADVDSNPANPVIGDRSFGRDPAHVARHVATYVRATQSKGLIACAKHFPGHGDTTVDSQMGVVIPRKTRVNDEFVGDSPEFTFEIHFEGDGKGRMLVNETEFPLSDKLTDLRLTGGLAIASTDDTAVLFTDVEIRPNKAFWPVAAKDDTEDAD